MSAPGPGACDACLRRAWLIGSLCERIDRVAAERRSEVPRALLALGDEELAGAVGGARAMPILEHARGRDATRLREAVRGSHCWACCRHDPRFPPQLLQLADPPATLFGRGDPSLLDALGGGTAAATIVGARRPSAYGREMAESLARRLAGCGVIVVSGMAFGIDSCAHAGALAAGGATVAVLGGGADSPTPRGKARLYEQLVGSGLVLSELPPGTDPRPWTFPARNRIMAALAGMTIVVEARVRSGSRITAEMAIELGRDVGAVPGEVGNPSAAGTNTLLREGAHVVRDAEDVLDSMLGVAGVPAREALDEPGLAGALTPAQSAALESV
ncbi:MAG: DNA-protecting protein DprA, partial [Actinobacteria bacterium]|nr:DNA-protecting protein DprA [Actinomycetota bacterium]